MNDRKKASHICTASKLKAPSNCVTMKTTIIALVMVTSLFQSSMAARSRGPMGSRSDAKKDKRLLVMTKSSTSSGSKSSQVKSKKIKESKSKKTKKSKSSKALSAEPSAAPSAVPSLSPSAAPSVSIGEFVNDGDLWHYSAEATLPLIKWLEGDPNESFSQHEHLLSQKVTVSC